MYSAGKVFNHEKLSLGIISGGKKWWNFKKNSLFFDEILPGEVSYIWFSNQIPRETLAAVSQV